MSVVSPGQETQVGGALPAFVEKARDDAQWRAALERAGYVKIKATFTQQVRDDPEASVLQGLQGLETPPPISLVREWLQVKSKSHLRRLQRTFLGTMLATIVSGFAFAAVYALLG